MMKKVSLGKTAAGVLFFVSLSALCFSAAQPVAAGRGSLKIGWAHADITPDQPVILVGSGPRVSRGTMDPITATALAIESTERAGAPVRIVMVSCDLLELSDTLRDSVRARLGQSVPDLDPRSVILNATHTHVAPNTMPLGHALQQRYRENNEPVANPYGVELPIMPSGEYVDFAAARIADAVERAWNSRAPGGIAFGQGYAVVSHNRLITFEGGASEMLGDTRRPDFSHVEGFEDHSVNILATYTPAGALTGMIINLTAPAQVMRGHLITADFWHETREKLRARFGQNLFILPQCSAAGDQNWQPPVERAAYERMWNLAGRTGREGVRAELAERIVHAVGYTLPRIEKEINWNPVCGHRTETVGLPRWMISEEYVQAREQRSQQAAQRYQGLRAELENNPHLKPQDAWYENAANEYLRSLQGGFARRRFEEQQRTSDLHVELNAVRLGDVGFATNPFELYLDYGMRIKGRSPAMQTFVVQMAGPGTYLPTVRAVAGGAYGAQPDQCEVGPEGGQKIVEWSIDALKELW